MPSITLTPEMLVGPYALLFFLFVLTCAALTWIAKDIKQLRESYKDCEAKREAQWGEIVKINKELGSVGVLTSAVATKLIDPAQIGNVQGVVK